MVHDFDPLLSDKHNLVSIAFTGVCNATEFINRQMDKLSIEQDCKINITWAAESQGPFTENISLDEITNLMVQINDIEIDTITPEVINYITNNIGNIFMESAMRSNIMSINETKGKSKKPKRKSIKQEWFNKDCEIER